jgi:hypothetical protein
MRSRRQGTSPRARSATASSRASVCLRTCVNATSSLRTLSASIETGVPDAHTIALRVFDLDQQFREVPRVAREHEPHAADPHADSAQGKRERPGDRAVRLKTVRSLASFNRRFRLRPPPVESPRTADSVVVWKGRTAYPRLGDFVSRIHALRAPPRTIVCLGVNYACTDTVASG